jgi:hypothetical protein
MQADDDPPRLSAATVQELARLAGYPVLAAEDALRIAAGATNAVRAVTASVTESLFEGEPQDYLATLERLGEPE